MVLLFEKSATINSSFARDKVPLFSDGDLVPDLKRTQVDMIEYEKSLNDFVWRDDRPQLISLSKKIVEKALEKADLEETDGDNLLRSLGSKLLHLACKLDSVECAAALIDGDAGLQVHINETDESGRTPLQNAAEMNSVRCTEFLLRKQASADHRSKDGHSLLAIEIALASKRLQVGWTPNDTVEELLVLLVHKDLRGIGMLAEVTKNITEVAYVLAMEGRVVGLAALLMVLPSEVGSTTRQVTSIYERVIGEAISLGQMVQTRNSSSSDTACPGLTRNRDDELRQLLLCEIELLQLFGAAAPVSSPTRKMTPLMSSCQAGDEGIVRLLLKTSIDVNDVDCEGNSALHWSLHGPSSPQESRLKIMWLLMRHGARVNHRNMLGLTPVHLAAAKGNSRALRFFLLLEPTSVDVVSETKETPLFLAVKNESIECAQLLMSFGANAQALNLRRERPVDLAKSQDMRFILCQANCSFWNHATKTEEDDSWWLSEEECTATIFDGFFDMKEKDTDLDRFCTNDKMELCRYFDSPSGCMRGSRCHFAHGEAELRWSQVGQSEFNQASLPQLAMRNVRKYETRMSEGLARKIFIGGLSPSVDSAYLKQFFEEEFGPVEDSVVIGSQAGDHLQSRGFGFVKFKHEDSAIAAVQAHYVTICGKKVEIKDAVPKATFQQSLTPELLNSNEKQPANDGKTESVSWVEKVLTCGLNNQQNKSLIAATGPKVEASSLPPWVATFRRWLPTFLVEVSKRLKEGEWYPLSSLKGDFRATCGMELDHVSLGYLKLSDFMRSFHGICRTKIVPVGRGPATHMVLLPSLTRPHNLPSSMEKRSRFYLERLTKPCDSRSLQLTDLDCEKSPLCSTDYGGDCTGCGGKGLAQSRDQVLSFLQADCSFLTPWSTTTGRTEAPGEGKPKLQSFSDKREDPPFSFFCCQWDYYENLRKKKLSECVGSEGGLSNIQNGDRSSSNCLLCKEKKALWVNMPCGHKVLCVTCKSKHIPRGRCMVCSTLVQCFLFAPWDTPRVKVESPTVCNHSSGLSFPSANHREEYHQESPVNMVSAFGCPKATFNSTGDGGGSSSKGSGGECNLVCVLCKERKAIWANVPCGHKVLCSGCKSGQLMRSATCITCHSPVQNLISLDE